MNPRSHPAITLFTHGMALAAGWAIFQSVDQRQTNDARSDQPSAPTKSSKRSSAAESSGREILAGVLTKVAAQPSGYDVTEVRYMQMQMDPKIRDRIDTIEVPGDFASALDDLLAAREGTKHWDVDILADPVALGFLWMSKDPQAFFAWLNGDSPNTRAIGHLILSQGFGELFRREGLDSVFPFLDMSGRYRQQLTSGLGILLATSGDAAGVLKARDLLPEENWILFSQNIGICWPDDQLAALIKLAVECDDPAIAIGHKVHDQDQGSYIASLLADESLPLDFRRRIGENDSARRGLMRDPMVPLEMRLENGADRNQIVRNDVIYLLTAERDWAHAFRNGEATAQEVLDTISAGTPDLAKAEPDAIREQVFRNLAEENPTRAMALLENLPETERDELALLTSRSHFDSVEPYKFLEMLEQVPADTPERWEGRLDAWNRRGFTNHERLQDGYVEWVQSLPPGIDREMGLYSLARAVDAGNPELATQLRGQVTDPDLQQRISQHR